ncbi:hypothetical protein ACJZ2D_003343 [Fusarium nematophilum]
MDLSNILNPSSDSQDEENTPVDPQKVGYKPQWCWKCYGWVESPEGHCGTCQLKFGEREPEVPSATASAAGSAQAGPSGSAQAGPSGSKKCPACGKYHSSSTLRCDNCATKDRIRERERRLRRKAEDRCYVCGKENLTEGATYCTGCSEKARANAARARAKKPKVEGKCTRCRMRDAAEDRSLCGECRRQGKEYAAKKRAEKKDKT